MSSALRVHDSAVATGTDAILDDVIEELANRIQSGEPVDGEAILARYPEHAESLRRLLPAIEVMAEFGVSANRLAARGVSAGLGPADVDNALGLLGDFRVLREVGRGGMGVVYEAEQMSLARQVALKVLPFAAALDPQQLRRFKTEAQAAAQLHHANIVPVFWVGCEQGVHYYAMQFIEGRSLAEVIREMRQIEGKEQSKVDAEPNAALGFPSPRGGEDARRAGEGDAQAAGADSDFPTPQGGVVPEGRRSAEEGAGEGEAAAPSAPPEPRPADGTPVGRGSPDPALPATEGLPPPSTERATTSPRNSSTRNRAYFRNVARLGIEAAEALEHAHQEGIIHRDIKPANLMVDAKGHLWVTDFGLARLQSDSGLTITGDIIGTLRYMSPEQALGRRVLIDARTDIYSLGVTLYELLTLQPAFESRDRQELLRQIADEEPRSPRKLNGSIPRELETIILKAMSKEAGSRYGTAQELADDWRRFLEEKPIRAKRPSLTERAAKWARRHPSFLALRQALATDQELADETPASLEYRYRVAWQWDNLGGLLLDGGKLNDAVDACRRSIEAAETLTKDTSGTPKYRQILAEAHNDLGRVFKALNQFRDAETEAAQATPILERLLAEDSHNESVRDSLADNLNTLGATLWATGRHKEAEFTFRRTTDLRQTLLDAAPRSRLRQDKLADSIANLGLVYSAMQNFREAEKMYRRVLPIRRKLAGQFPSVPGYRQSLAEDLGNLAIILRRSGKPHEAAPLYREAVALLEGLVRDHPDLPENRAALANALRNFGVPLSELGKKAEAEESLRRATETLEPLIADHPEVPIYMVRFLEQAMGRAKILADLRRWNESERLYRQGLDRSGRLAGEHPKEPEYTELHLRIQVAFGEVMKQEHRDIEARDAFEAALERADSLVRENPQWAPGREFLGWVAGRLSKQLSTAADPTARDPAKAIALAARAVALGPESRDVWNVAGEAHFRAHHWDDAIRALQRACEMTRDDDEDVTGWYHLAMAYWQKGDREQACRWYRKAVAWMEKNRFDNDDFYRLRAEASAMLGVTDQPAATGKKEENATLPSKP